MPKFATGRLTNPEVWQSRLPQEVFLALNSWVESRALHVTHVRWLDGGISGSHVAVVDVFPLPSGPLGGRILKLLPPEMAGRESAGVALAKRFSPKFCQEHVVDTEEIGFLPGLRWGIHIQQSAHADLRDTRSLSDLAKEWPGLAEVCGYIVWSLATEWNGLHDGANDKLPWRMTLRDFLIADLGDERLRQLQLFSNRLPDVFRGGVVRLPRSEVDLPNPLPFAGVAGCATHSYTIYVGKGHDDFNTGNVLVPGRPQPIAEKYQLIDLGRFTGETPVSRDAVKLTLSLAEGWLASLDSRSTARSVLAELIAAPARHKVTPLTSGYAPIVTAIYGAAYEWGYQRNVGEQWAQQHLVVLASSALRYVARTDFTTDDRLWYLRVGALAIKELMEPGQRLGPVERFDPSEPLSRSGKAMNGDQAASPLPALGVEQADELVNLILAVPGMTDPSFRQELVNRLPATLAQQMRRYAMPRMEIVAMVDMFADNSRQQPWKEFVRAMRSLLGASDALDRLETTLVAAGLIGDGLVDRL